VLPAITTNPRAKLIHPANGNDVFLIQSYFYYLHKFYIRAEGKIQLFSPNLGIQAQRFKNYDFLV
jgi:hypothetical protein